MIGNRRGNVVFRQGIGEFQVGQAVLQVGILEVLEHVHRRREAGECFQTLLGSPAVLRDVPLDQRQQQIAVGLGQKPLRDEQVFQGLGFLQDPRLHALDQLILGEKIHLQRQDAEQQISIRRRPL